MSMVTVSAAKRGRPRKFDYELAREMRAAGESYEAIGRKLGASGQAVGRACNPAVNAAAAKRSNEWLRENCRAPCAGCGTLVWHLNAARSGLCRRCFAVLQVAEDVRDDALRCTKCREWKPDEDFGAETQKKAYGRRGRRQTCRTCRAAAEADRRSRSNREAERTAGRRQEAKATAV